jgi:hypothetical protein
MRDNSVTIDKLLQYKKKLVFGDLPVSVEVNRTDEMVDIGLGGHPVFPETFKRIANQHEYLIALQCAILVGVVPKEYLIDGFVKLIIGRFTAHCSFSIYNNYVMHSITSIIEIYWRSLSSFFLKPTHRETAVFEHLSMMSCRIAGRAESTVDSSPA